MNRPTRSSPELDALRFYYEHTAAHPADPMALRRDVLSRLSTDQKSTAAGRRWRTTLLVTATAGLAALTAVVIAAPLGRNTSHPTREDQAISSTLDAQQTLRLVAQRTDNAPAASLPAGGYVYTDYQAEQLNKAPVGKDTAWYVSRTRIQTWAATNGLAPVRMVITTGLDARALTATDAAKLSTTPYPWKTSHTTTFPDPSGAAPGTDPTSGADLSKPGFANPTPAYLASLPTDPRTLLTTIREQLPALKPDPSGQADVQQVFLTVATLVTKADALLSPQLRTALYQALASLPGITRLPGATDLAGRSGLAISRTADGVRCDLILDQASSRVIGVRQVLTDAPGGTVPAGTVQEWSTTNQKVVTTVGATS
jgi:hypothetical protein